MDIALIHNETISYFYITSNTFVHMYAMHTYWKNSITIVLREAVQIMAFQIKPDKRETENKTIRFPLPLIEEINSVIQKNDVTFSGFVIQACEYALENMEQTQSKKKEKK